MNRNRTRAVNSELRSDQGQLVITWKEGDESHYDLEQLRRSCPCAVCRELRLKPQPSGELTLLDGAAASATASATRLDLVGRYGVRITWADGHDTGIYTFETLREMDSGSDS